MDVSITSDSFWLEGRGQDYLLVICQVWIFIEGRGAQLYLTKNIYFDYEYMLLGLQI